MNFVSLFSGVGGFDLGFEDAGMECAAQVEIDDAARGVLDRRFPGVRKFTDVREFGNEHYPKGSIDVVCGGFPCQDLSIAGKRAGLAGERSGLWWEFARIIDELEPRIVVIENVPGLLSSNGGRDFAIILQWLVKRGYGVCWRILDAQYFGVPQRRRRVIIVASFGNGRAAEILFESQGVRRDPAAGGEPGKEIAFSSRANPSHSGDKGDGGINTTLVARPLRAQAQMAHREDADTLIVAKAIGAHPTGHYNHTQDNLIVGFNPKASDSRSMPVLEGKMPTLETNHQGMAVAFDGRNLDDNEVSPTLQAKEKGYSLNYAPMVFQQNGRNEVRFVGGDGQNTAALDNSKGSKQTNYIAGSGVRRLTPTECERLQGFPDGWTEGQSDSARYRQMGNAVAVVVARWLGKRIVAAG